MSKYLIDGDEFEGYLKRNKVVLVDFSSPFCAPCKKVPPVFEEVEKEFGENVCFLEINVAEDNDLALNYDVFSVPTIIVFKEGVERERILGVPNKKKLSSILKNLFS